MTRAALLILALALTACGAPENPELMNISQSRGEGPDEFGILPTKPLVIPENTTALPTPTPGGSNLSDPTPFRDVANALGGNAAALDRPSRDGALVAAATRFGVDPAIRPTLAAEDLEYRRANDGRLLERLFNVNVYFQAYAPYALDQFRELARLRAAGLRTSSIPPDPALQ